MSDRQRVEQWVGQLFAAWQEADPGRVSALFTPDAEYLANPFRPPKVGRGEISAYWAAAVATQEDRDIRVGSPVVEGSRAAVEWWAVIRENDVDSTSTGSLFLVFDNEGRCRSLREVWAEQPGRGAPYPGWGT